MGLQGPARLDESHHDLEVPVLEDGEEILAEAREHRSSSTKGTKIEESVVASSPAAACSTGYIRESSRLARAGTP